MSTQPEVTTKTGIVRGLWREESAAFLGIPFAEPPIGDLRFAAPVPHHSWAGVRDAAHYAATPQRETLAEITLIPEPSIPGRSTLNVNVFTPCPGESEAGLPVLVYIHGGGYVAGSPASPWYDGAAFNRDGVVTVSVSYRLGFDGFGWIADAPNNRGVLDWILALEWVQENIASFGGDPAKVTIAGQSAGAGAVLTLLGVPRAAGLFHQVISLSGTTVGVPLADAEQYGRQLAAAAGVEPTREGLSTLDETRVLEIQNALGSPVPTPGEGAGGPAPDPLAFLKAMSSGLALRWAPVIDGDLLPESIDDAIGAGAGGDKAVLLGTTDNEFNMALAGQKDALAAIDPVAALVSTGVPEPVAQDYVTDHAGLDTAELLGQFTTDTMFRAPVRKLAELRSRGGTPAWLYRFSWPSPTFGGAVHCLDMPFFFHCLAEAHVPHITGAIPPPGLAEDVHGAAVRFISTGTPGWPAYTTPDRDVRVYNTPSVMVSDAYADVALLAGETPAPVH